MAVPPASKRCIEKTSKGNRCRNPRYDTWNVCELHLPFKDGLKVGRIMLRNRIDLETAEGIHQLLAHTARRLAAGRIPERRATALAYLAQMMMTTLPRVHQERESYRDVGLRVSKTWEHIKDCALLEAVTDETLDFDSIMRVAEEKEGEEEEEEIEEEEKGAA